MTHTQTPADFRTQLQEERKAKREQKKKKDKRRKSWQRLRQ
jgi:5'-3' exonuclease